MSSVFLNRLKLYISQVTLTISLCLEMVIRVVFKVRERETISEISVFEGNKDLKEEQLIESLDGSDIRVGETLDRTVIIRY